MALSIELNASLCYTMTPDPFRQTARIASKTRHRREVRYQQPSYQFIIAPSTLTVLLKLRSATAPLHYTRKEIFVSIQ